MNRDVEIFDVIRRERERQTKGIELIASENFVSDQVMEAMGSVLTNKYAEGYPGHRYYGGCEVVDIAENIARDRLKKLYNAEYVNVQPHSGAQASWWSPESRFGCELLRSDVQRYRLRFGSRDRTCELR